MTLPLSARYFQRLKLDPSKLDRSPTLAKLTSIVEAHVEHIPFENLSQHGAARPACLDVHKTANKILDGYRGGFCYEVNSLLSEFLSVELGYRVHRLPAIVYSKDQGYNKPPDGYFDSHICMIVTIDNDDYFVDVGHGEPPLHPLKFEFDTEQKTPEGMISRFIDNGKDVGLERWSEDSCSFEPTIQFKWQQVDASSDVENYKLEPLSEFRKDFELQFINGSPFVQKIICCRITRTHKYTVAGHRLKITTPRFGPDSQKTVSEIESSDEGRSILKDIFGMPLEETEGLDFQLSKTADPAIHSQF
jgi:arylamine N-acetyltransferase